jgi:hypothetical protein
VPKPSNRIKIETDVLPAPRDSMSHIWDPTRDTVDTYLRLVLPFFKADGLELIFSDCPVTRLVSPEVQQVCFGGRVDSTVNYKYVTICKAMNEFWLVTRRSPRRKAKITNILPLEGFVKLVKKPLHKVPPCLRENWPKLRLTWLEDLDHQIQEGRCTPLFIRRAALEETLADKPDIREMINAYATLAIVDDCHCIRRDRPTNELKVTSNSPLIEGFNEGLKRLEARALEESGHRPIDYARKVMSSLIDWCKDQPR